MQQLQQASWMNQYWLHLQWIFPLVFTGSLCSGCMWSGPECHQRQHHCWAPEYPDRDCTRLWFRPPSCLEGMVVRAEAIAGANTPPCNILTGCAFFPLCQASSGALIQSCFPPHPPPPPKKTTMQPSCEWKLGCLYRKLPYFGKCFTAILGVTLGLVHSWEGLIHLENALMIRKKVALKQVQREGTGVDGFFPLIHVNFLVIHFWTWIFQESTGM